MQTQRGREITGTGIEKLGKGVLSSSSSLLLPSCTCLLGHENVCRVRVKED